MRLLAVLPAFLATLLAIPLSAQQRTMLVLDGSGSMWGQVAGVPKINLARDVVGTLLGTLPDEAELGLVAYGHRREGDCSDIETLVPPGPRQHEAVATAIAELTPRGKTAMAEAVRHAAEALKEGQGPSTVILISDGIETCTPDPCAVTHALAQARAALKVHVVGFDVSEEQAQEQMRCMAESTGGDFIVAHDAETLQTALHEVTQTALAPPAARSHGPKVETPQRQGPEPTQETVIATENEPEQEAEAPNLPAVQPVLFRATRGNEGPEITAPLFWQITNREGAILTETEVSSFSLAIPVGSYGAELRERENEVPTVMDFEVAGGAEPIEVIVALPPPGTQPIMPERPKPEPAPKEKDDHQEEHAHSGH